MQIGVNLILLVIFIHVNWSLASYKYIWSRGCLYTTPPSYQQRNHHNHDKTVSWLFNFRHGNLIYGYMVFLLKRINAYAIFPLNGMYAGHRDMIRCLKYTCPSTRSSTLTTVMNHKLHPGTNGTLIPWLEQWQAQKLRKWKKKWTCRMHVSTNSNNMSPVELCSISKRCLNIILSIFQCSWKFTLLTLSALTRHVITDATTSSTQTGNLTFPIAEGTAVIASRVTGQFRFSARAMRGIQRVWL